MNTHESYVSLETAKLLKEAGFKWGCDYMYGLAVRHNGKEIDEDEEYELKSRGKADEIEYVDGGEVYRLYYDNTEDYNGYARPTLSMAQKWLREEKEIYAEAYISESHHAVVWMASVYQWEKRPLGRELRDKCLCTGIGPVYFDTYEQALEESVKKCLTLLLEE